MMKDHAAELFGTPKPSRRYTVYKLKDFLISSYLWAVVSGNGSSKE